MNKKTRNPHTILVIKPDSTQLFEDNGLESGVNIKMDLSEVQCELNSGEWGDEFMSPRQEGDL
jgi:hypothetical protein